MKHHAVLKGSGGRPSAVLIREIFGVCTLAGVVLLMTAGPLAAADEAAEQTVKDPPVPASAGEENQAAADEPSDPSPNPVSPPASVPTPPAAAWETQPAVNPAKLPFVRINREKHWIDFDAKVVLRDGQWVELLVCTPGTREYESILSTEARPSHLHLALLILNQSPGQPLGWKREGGQVVSIAPSGPEVGVYIRYLQNDQMVEVPAGQWVMDQKANKTLEDATWLFAGSKFMALEGRPVYLADVNGSCISLVNFGDDLLTRPTETTHHNDNAQFAANTQVIPQVGTAVVVRLKVKPKAAGDAPVGNLQESTETPAENAAVESETTSQP